MGLLTTAVALPLLHIRALRRQRAELWAEVGDKTAALEKLARTDALTGLPNRRAFDQALAQQWAANGRPLSLLMIDIDHFKSYNDTLGHPAGDRCLSTVGRLLAGAARHPADMAARIGGEEFAILLPGTSMEAARTVAQRIRDELQQRGLPHPASPIGPLLTVSIGIAQKTAKMADPEALTDVADHALYEAKHWGRNQIVLAEPAH